MAEFDIFISHSAKDKEFVRRLRTDLEIYGHRIWVDELYLAVGTLLNPGLQSAIRDSRFVAVVYSRDSLASPWVERERLFAVAEGIPIIPIVLDRDGLPDEVSSQVYADFTELDDQQAYHRALHNVLGLLGAATNAPEKLHIYTSSLTPGWLNSSWDARTVERYSLGEPARICFKADLSSFGGVGFVFRSGIGTAPFSCLRFSLHGGEVGSQILKVYVNDRIGNGIRNPITLGALPADRWESYCISLEDLDAKNLIIFKVNWSHVTGDIGGPIYLADVHFAR